ncbi:Protein of unknown function DUF2921 [Dillenia turbinata]|uniref:RING-type E3 ubiquitin transferase n=1 Tax=Dillenia turbinata TaxID=194707 RepID=A0AAN8ULA0_9MAGN
MVMNLLRSDQPHILLFIFILIFNVCASSVFAQESNRLNTEVHRDAFLGLENAIFTGGNQLLQSTFEHLLFPDRHIFRIESENGMNQSSRTLLWRSELCFRLNGFWSSSSGKLYMVGSGSGYVKGKLRNANPVLKLNCPLNTTRTTSLFTGRLESVDMEDSIDYVEPIHILAISQLNYEYTLMTEAKKTVLRTTLRLHYFYVQPSWWRFPFLANVMYLTKIQCSEKLKVRILLQFFNSSSSMYYQPLDPDTTLVAEGAWDARTRILHLIAYHILDLMHSLVNALVGDCSIRLSVRLPAILTVTGRSTAVGNMWSSKSVNDYGYFPKLGFWNSGDWMSVCLEVCLLHMWSTANLEHVLFPLVDPWTRTLQKFPHAVLLGFVTSEFAKMESDPPILSLLIRSKGCQTSLILFISILFINLSVSFSISPRTSLSYRQHCNLIVPESIPTSKKHPLNGFLELGQVYFSGGDRLPELTFTSLFFSNRQIYLSQTRGVFKVEATLSIRGPLQFPSSGSFIPSAPSKFDVELQGFWSSSSRKLCMVGSGSGVSSGNLHNLTIVLKLNHPNSSSIVSSLIHGVLESSDKEDNNNYFEPIPLFALSRTNYEADNIDRNEFSGEDDSLISSSLTLEAEGDICLTLRRLLDMFELIYDSDCDTVNCNPLGRDFEFLPSMITFKGVDCLDQYILRTFIGFSNSDNIVPDQFIDHRTTFVAEGTWDTQNSRLSLVACRVVNFTYCLVGAFVGDCSVRLNLRFPAFLSVRNRSTIVGKIWSENNIHEAGYFSPIFFQNLFDRSTHLRGLNYEYSEINTAKQTSARGGGVKCKQRTYSMKSLLEMRLNMLVGHGKRQRFWGYASPLSIGDHMFENLLRKKMNLSGPVNISYQMTFKPPPDFDHPLSKSVELLAEGVYNATSGSLCMLGCRLIRLRGKRLTRNSLMDCEILINVRFSSIDASKNFVFGTIESMRRKSDLLYFRPLEFSSLSFNFEEAETFISRMKMEIRMDLISSTFAFVFIALQLQYMRKHREVIPFMSIMTLVAILLWPTIHILLDSEAMFLANFYHKDILFSNTTELEENAVLVKMAAVIVFSLAFRLLYLAWSARSGAEIHSNLSVSEKKVVVSSLATYLGFVLIARQIHQRICQERPCHLRLSCPENLESYLGPVLDCFLLPQILFNFFCKSKEKPLAPFFYVGMTALRLLPHTYSLNGSQTSTWHLGSIYANPQMNLYSTTWDIMICCIGLLLAFLLHLQQRKLCMIGSGRGFSSDSILDLNVIVKFNYANTSSILKSLVNGVVERNDDLVGGSLSLEKDRDLCSMLSKIYGGYELIYESDCENVECNPFGERFHFVPSLLSFSSIRCLDERRLQLLVNLFSSVENVFVRDLAPNATLVAEGKWDEKRNRFLFVACQILYSMDSLSDSSTGNCFVRFSLRFCGFLTLRNRSVVGKIWSNQTVNGSAYYGNSWFWTARNKLFGLAGLKYEYSEIDTLTKTCSFKRTNKHKVKTYPNGHSSDMRFRILLGNNKEEKRWGSATPLFVGNQFYGPLAFTENTSSDSLLKISYRISFTAQPSFMSGSAGSPLDSVEILAEGLCDAKAGVLCMIGCKHLRSIQTILTQNNSLDCGISVNAQLSPLDAKVGGTTVKGTIESIRQISDPLYFQRLEFSSRTIYSEQAKSSLWRMDLEITMFHFLQLAFSARSGDGNQKILSYSEKKMMFNIFCNSGEKSFAASFYVGTSVVRILPHAYGLYRAHASTLSLNLFYIYANPWTDLFSTAWDVIILCCSLLFVASLPYSSTMVAVASFLRDSERDQHAREFL